MFTIKNILKILTIFRLILRRIEGIGIELAFYRN